MLDALKMEHEINNAKNTKESLNFKGSIDKIESLFEVENPVKGDLYKVNDLFYWYNGEKFEIYGLN